MIDTNIQISPVDVKERKELGVKSGDTVRVWQKIEEKGKTRLQAFEGVVLAVKHGTEAGATFTVRKVSLGVGVEKIFPLYSPNIDKIEILKRARVRRNKLYFVRDKVSKELRRIFRKSQEVNIATKGAAELEEERKRAEEELKKQQEQEAKLAQEQEEKEVAETEVETENEAVSDTDDEVAENISEGTEEKTDADANKETEANKEDAEDVGENQNETQEQKEEPAQNADDDTKETESVNEDPAQADQKEQEEK